MDGIQRLYYHQTLQHTIDRTEFGLATLYDEVNNADHCLMLEGTKVAFINRIYNAFRNTFHIL